MRLCYLGSIHFMLLREHSAAKVQGGSFWAAETLNSYRREERNVLIKHSCKGYFESEFQIRYLDKAVLFLRK